jgi:pimeloyl-ACP methyl ester carboxylesterase
VGAPAGIATAEWAPATDGRATAARFAGERQHRVIPNVGHNLPEESPTEFADAVSELAAKN